MNRKKNVSMPLNVLIPMNEKTGVPNKSGK